MPPLDVTIYIRRIIVSFLTIRAAVSWRRSPTLVTVKIGHASKTRAASIAHVARKIISGPRHTSRFFI